MEVFKKFDGLQFQSKSVLSESDRSFLYLENVLGRSLFIVPDVERIALPSNALIIFEVETTLFAIFDVLDI
jgi:hypothetical protein